MGATTLGLKVDEALRARLRAAADRVGRTPHWLIKQGLVALLERIERGDGLPAGPAADGLAAEDEAPHSGAPQPFLEFAQSVQPQSVLRAAITAAYRRPEEECLPALLAAAQLPAQAAARAQALATKLVEALRTKPRGGIVEGVIQEFALSSQEGVALMCLAEALLRIPDRATRDALIRDKISLGDWQAHLGHSPSLFVNAAAWGLMITGRLVGTSSETGLTQALTRMIGRGGEPLIRKGVDMAMRLMGEQFVCGETIAEALANSRRLEARGFRYSYDMLGEAATTAADAARYQSAYEQAIQAIGTAAERRGIHDGPGISIKLSALHPRYCRAQAERVTAELLPRLQGLAILARRYDIGLNIDAEEADRLEISLDLLESLAFAPELAGWNGLGFVVQAYQKRAPFVIDFLVDLARRARRRLMVRLVKGAYWDAEIKRAQVDGLEGFPVFTRKPYTDVSYLACARRLLAAPEAVFPQFATHNAGTLAAIMEMAGPKFAPGDYEFQCLHGMGEPLYDEVVGAEKLGRPCRIYAPVGTHETLLAYLVRRLLENGANTSFVNRIADPKVPVAELVADPVAVASAIVPLGAPHAKISLPSAIFGDSRKNSAGIDFSNEQRLASLSAALLAANDALWRAVPSGGSEAAPRPVRNPADHRDVVGHVTEASEAEVDAAVALAAGEGAVWQATPPAERAAVLLRAADLLEEAGPRLMGLIVREAGKTLPNALGEIREAVDFLRYYATQARDGLDAETHRPLGPVACISPWNFPLAIFCGQVGAALAAGNPVLAKPAEETPLIAAQAVRLLHIAGVPASALHLLPGDGRIGARLVANAHVRGVMFTGSTEVARLIARSLAGRLDPSGHPIPLIAETGGQNALIVDSSALPEQVVGDVLASAFDSAGQRCSALRVLCVQEDAAERVRGMLLGAMQELAIGNPDHLALDVGPVIAEEAKAGIVAHIEAMRARGHAIHQLALPPACRHGSFVPPTIIEIASISELSREVFGPVLHLLRYRRDGLDELVRQINATGYGLTFGVHSRIDETISRLATRIHAGNVYVNRNLIGAVVGSQPFGGHGLSGTGPKAGGPLYLHRLLASRPPDAPITVHAPESRLGPARAWADFVETQGRLEAAAHCRRYFGRSLLGVSLELPGPVGERNLYTLEPRGMVLCLASNVDAMCIQVGAAMATGNHALVLPPPDANALVAALPHAARCLVRMIADPVDAVCDAVLYEGDGDALRHWAGVFARREGALIPLHSVARGALAAGAADYALEWLLLERVVSTNTTAAGGNASLMTIG
jgi:RHH-type proline utilization regulon transcriptional repressor/proline dehydrogenase/delta 1-pyrroline-5-carboxylate dehydrogenase